jgi:hypothetical protein
MEVRKKQSARIAVKRVKAFFVLRTAIKEKVLPAPIPPPSEGWIKTMTTSVTTRSKCITRMNDCMDFCYLKFF